MEKTVETGVSHTQTYSVWIDFLKNTADGEKNQRLLAQYFGQSFLQTPEDIAPFLRVLSSTIAKSTPADRKKMSERYLTVLSPLCERFGVFEEKARMDTLCFRVSNPESFKEVNNLLESYKVVARRLVPRITRILKELIEENRYSCVVGGRFKHSYSIHKKMRMKGKRLPSLFDIFAFRVVLTKQGSDVCFDVLNLLHDRFTPIPSRFKDYITVPKVNGYQSLHTILNNVVPELDLPIELQIRTSAMHDFAEHGIAAHWMYAKDKKTKLVSEKEFKLMDHLKSMQHHDQRVYCFTPKGDLQALPIGATMRTFAHAIHSHVGRNAVSALVNDQPASLDAAVQEGVRIRIVTAQAA